MPEQAILWEKEGGVTLVRFKADSISEEAYSRRASDELKKLASGIGGNVIVSLANVKFMSSPGLAALIWFNRLLRSLGGQLKICDLQPLVKQIFTSSGLDKALDICGSKEEAMAALKHGPQEKADGSRKGEPAKD